MTFHQGALSTCHFWKCCTSWSKCKPKFGSRILVHQKRSSLKFNRHQIVRPFCRVHSRVTLQKRSSDICKIYFLLVVIILTIFGVQVFFWHSDKWPSGEIRGYPLFPGLAHCHIHFWHFLRRTRGPNPYEVVARQTAWRSWEKSSTSQAILVEVAGIFLWMLIFSDP